MLRRLSLVSALLFAAHLAAKPLPSDPSAWYRDPLQWQALPNGVWRVLGNAGSLNVCEQLPVCKNAEVGAVVKGNKADPEGWSVAGVALVDDQRNFWHVALVEAPEKSGGKRYFELCEMLDGQWLSQNTLKNTLLEEKGVWEPNVPVRLTLKLDPTGIEGKAEKPDGTLLFRKRYAFSAEAVTVGRPALRAGGFHAEFRDLRGTWSNPAPKVTKKAEFPPYAVKSFVPGLTGKATGFFRVEQRDGIWWAFDPLGRGFVPLGIDHVSYRGAWCETLGYAPHGKKNDAKFANRGEWADQTIDRLTSWGFNLLTAGCDPLLLHRGLGHTVALSVGNRMAILGDEFDITPNERRPCSAFPNVFHPEFASFCRYRIRTLAGPHVGDPWLFGYFLDNELAWWGRGATDTGLFDATMAKNAKHTAKLALRDLLKKRFKGDLAACNQAFKTDLASFDAVLDLDALPTATDEARATKHAFLTECAERYFGTLARAIHEVDPDHMILGCRFAGGRVDPIVWKTAGKYSEILTFNYYGSVDLDRKMAVANGRVSEAPPLARDFSEFYEKGGHRPMMVTEWSFPALDSGLPCTKGAGQRFRTQAERAEASNIYARTILSIPFMIGYDYFMWVDEPALGISTPFPENSNYGIINEDGAPYPLLVKALSTINLKDAPAIHRTGETGIPAPAATEVAKPPKAPKGTEWVLWNQSGEALPAGPVVLPSGTVPAVIETPAVKASGAYFIGAQARLEKPAAPTDVLSAPMVWTNNTAWLTWIGKWKISGQKGKGPLVQSITYDGVPLGHYSAMVQQYAGANRWNETNHTVSVEHSGSVSELVLTLTGEFRPGEGDASQGFRTVHRLVFPKDQDWFAAQILSITNLGKEPLNIRALFFRFHGAVGGDAEGDVPADAVPRLWKADPQNAWYDEKADAFFGATAPASSGASIRFWLNKQGGQHPDAKTEYEEELAPGKTFVPATPAVVYGFAGKGADWQKVAQRVAARHNFVKPE
jgi:agarase